MTSQQPSQPAQSAERHIAFIENASNVVEKTPGLERTMQVMSKVWQLIQPARLHELLWLPGRQEWLLRQSYQRLRTAAEEYVGSAEYGYRERQPQKHDTQWARSFVDDQHCLWVELRFLEPRAGQIDLQRSPVVDRIKSWRIDVSGETPVFYQSIGADEMQEHHYSVAGANYHVTRAADMLFESMPVGEPWRQHIGDNYQA